MGDDSARETDDLRQRVTRLEAEIAALKSIKEQDNSQREQSSTKPSAKLTKDADEGNSIIKHSLTNLDSGVKTRRTALKIDAHLDHQSKVAANYNTGTLKRGKLDHPSDTFRPSTRDRSPSTSAGDGLVGEKKKKRSSVTKDPDLRKCQLDGGNAAKDPSLRRSTRRTGGNPDVDTQAGATKSPLTVNSDDEGRSGDLSDADSEWLGGVDSEAEIEVATQRVRTRKRQASSGPILPKAKRLMRTLRSRIASIKEKDGGRASSASISSALSLSSSDEPATQTIPIVDAPNDIADYTTSAPMSHRFAPIIEIANLYIPKTITLKGLVESCHPDYMVGDALLFVLLHCGKQRDTDGFELIRKGCKKRNIAGPSDEVLRQRKREALKMVATRNKIAPAQALKNFQTMRQASLGTGGPGWGFATANNTATEDRLAGSSFPLGAASEAPIGRKSEAGWNAINVVESSSSEEAGGGSEADAETEADSGTDGGTDSDESSAASSGAEEEEMTVDVSQAPHEETEAERDLRRRDESLTRAMEAWVKANLKANTALDSDIEVLSSDGESISSEGTPTTRLRSPEAIVMPPPQTPVAGDYTRSSRIFAEPLGRDSLPASSGGIDERMEPATLHSLDLSPLERKKTTELPSAGLEGLWENEYPFPRMEDRADSRLTEAETDEDAVGEDDE